MSTVRALSAIAALALTACGGTWAPTYSLGRYAERGERLRDRVEEAVEAEGLARVEDEEGDDRVLVHAPGGQGAIAIEPDESGWLTVSPVSHDARPLRGGWHAPPRLVRDHAEVTIRLRERLDAMPSRRARGARALGEPGGEGAPTDRVNPRWEGRIDLGAVVVGGVGLAASWALGIALGVLIADDAEPGDGCAAEYQSWSSVPVIGGLASSVVLAGCRIHGPVTNAAATAAAIFHSALDISFTLITALALVIPVQSIALDGPRSPTVSVSALPLGDGAGLSISGTTF